MKLTQQNSGGKEFTVPNWSHKKWEPWFILVFAFLYYGIYYRNGFDLGGEGGTVGMIALRLLEGQRPVVDTFLGYNVLWFYPIVGLFKIFGVNFLIIKIYFFCLCIITAVLATVLVRRVTHYSVLAVGTGIIVTLIPGTQFRNYLPFLAVLNMVVLFHVFVFPQKSFWKRQIWFSIAGVVLGLTYLIRIDVGLLITSIILILLLIFPWSTEQGFWSGVNTAIMGTLTIAIFTLLIHVPVVWDANRRGFQKQFLGQYAMWFNYIRRAVTNACLKNTDVKQTPSFQQTLPLKNSQEKQAVTEIKSLKSILSKTANPADKTTLSRPPLSSVMQRKTVPRMFAWVIYMPVPIIFLICTGMGIIWIVSIWRQDFQQCQRALGVLIALGCACSLFPQYFFFRPDTPHASEFMVPFIITIVLVCFEVIRMAKVKRTILPWVYAILLLIFCVPDCVAHLSNGLRRASSGSIAAKKQRGQEFVADNKVRVFVDPEKFQELQGIYSTIKHNSKPTDWVVCYPYLPSVNFMTNRKSYEYNLYVDNATKGENFDDITINKFLHFQPAVIAINHVALNHNEASYFKNWASSTYQFIKNHYRFAGTYGNTEIYLKKKE